MIASELEENSRNDTEEGATKQVTALTDIYDFDEESDYEELNFEDIATSYKELCLTSEEVCQLGEKQRNTITHL